MLGSGRECMIMTGPFAGTREWYLHCYNDTIGNALEIMAPTFGTTYAQLAADDTVAVDSDQSGDTTQVISVYGIDSTGKKRTENITATGTTEADGAITFSYIENIWASALSAGIMSLKRTTGDTYIMEIEAGFLNSGIAQHFNGESQSYITMFSGGLYDTTKDCMFELRWYPNDSSCRGTSTGYEVLDRIFTPVEVGNIPPSIKI